MVTVSFASAFATTMLAIFDKAAASASAAALASSLEVEAMTSTVASCAVTFWFERAASDVSERGS